MFQIGWFQKLKLVQLEALKLSPLTFSSLTFLWKNPIWNSHLAPQCCTCFRSYWKNPKGDHLFLTNTIPRRQRERDNRTDWGTGKERDWYQGRDTFSFSRFFRFEWKNAASSRRPFKTVAIWADLEHSWRRPSFAVKLVASSVRVPVS